MDEKDESIPRWINRFTENPSLTGDVILGKIPLLLNEKNLKVRETPKRQVAERDAERTWSRPAFVPHTDIYEVNGEIIIVVDMPGVDAESVDPDDPVGFLVGEGGAGSVTEAAYRFCRWEPGLDVVLSGTGRVEHLRANARSLDMPDLPARDRARLGAMFARVDDVTGG